MVYSKVKSFQIGKKCHLIRDTPVNVSVNFQAKPFEACHVTNGRWNCSCKIVAA